MEKPIMTFQIFTDDAQVSNMEGPYGAVTFIPFTGKVESELFTGEILPGAVDVQVENVAGSRHMCAKYMFRGKDSEGTECYLFVENNGYFTKANREDAYLHACPRFITDSRVLGEYLCRGQFRSEVQGRKGGVEIRIYDVMKND
ncbi:MAG: DUF3237 family protein [Eubacteriales bacterium]|nr:DUF3237 family protein [Eubacteriales bacterium]